MKCLVVLNILLIFFAVQSPLQSLGVSSIFLNASELSKNLPSSQHATINFFPKPSTHFHKNRIKNRKPQKRSIYALDENSRTKDNLLFSSDTESKNIFAKNLFISEKKDTFLKRILYVALKVTYYLVYFLSSFFCDIIAFSLIISIQHFISGTYLIYFIIIFFCIRFFLAGLDALITERTKKYMKKFSLKKQKKFERKLFLEKLKNYRIHLKYLVNTDMPSLGELDTVLDSFLSLIKDLKLFPEKDKDFLSFILLNFREKSTFAYPEFLFLINVVNIYGLSGKDVYALYHKISQEGSIESALKNPQEYHLSDFEKYILLHIHYSQIFYNNKKEDFLLFLIEHINELSRNEKEEKSYYLMALHHMGVALTDAQNIEKMDLRRISKHIRATLEQKNDLFVFQNIISIFSKSPRKEELLTFFQAQNNFVVFGKNFYKKRKFQARWENDEDMVETEDDFLEIVSQKKFLLNAITDSFQTMQNAEECVESLEFFYRKIREMKLLPSDRFVEEKKKLYSSLLHFFTKNYLKNLKQMKREKEMLICLLKNLLNDENPCPFPEVVEELILTISATDCTQKIFPFSNEFKNLPHGKNLKYKFYAQESFYFVCFYTLGAALISGFVTIIFLNPFFTIPISPYIVSVFIGISVALMQIAKGWSRMRSYFYANIPSENRFCYGFVNALEKLINNSDFQIAPSFQKEKYIFEEFQAAFSAMKICPTLKDWRSFYIQAIKGTKQKNKLVFALSKFALFIKKNPSIVQEDNIAKLHEQIHKFTREYEIAEEDYFHFFNIVNYKYICSPDALYDGKNPLKYFEAMSDKFCENSDLFRSKLFYFLLSICRSECTLLSEKRRIIHYIIEKMRERNKENFSYCKECFFVLSSFLNSDDPDVWKVCYDVLIDEIDFSFQSYEFWKKLFKKVSIKTEKMSYFLEQIVQKKNSSKKVEKIVFFIMSTQCLIPFKRSVLYRLPDFFYKRYTEYSLIALFCFGLAILIVRCLFIRFHLFSIVAFYFFVQVVILNLVGFIGRIEKDFIEYVFDKKIYAFDIRNRSSIESKKLTDCNLYFFLKKEIRKAENTDATYSEKLDTVTKKLFSHLRPQKLQDFPLINGSVYHSNGAA